MTRRKKTDGERIADRVFFSDQYRQGGLAFPSVLAADIDRLVRRRMAEAWDEGWVASYNNLAVDVPNPYRRKKVKA